MIYVLQYIVAPLNAKGNEIKEKIVHMDGFKKNTNLQIFNFINSTSKTYF